MPLRQLLFSFRGRLNRKPWWIVSLISILALIIGLAVAFVATEGHTAGLKPDDPDASLGIVGLALLLLILAILCIWIGLALSAKRLHDRDKSAWWLLVFYLLPGVLDGIGSVLGAGGIGVLFHIAAFAISIWGLVELGFLRGTVGPNQYGPDPLEGKV